MFIVILLAVRLDYIIWMVCSRLQIRSGGLGLVTRFLSFETEAAAILLVP